MAELSAQPRLARTRDLSGPAGKGSRASQRRGEGQQATAAGLDLLRVLGWLVLHEVDLPADPATGAPDVAVDHLLVGPSGVYVVNTVTWPGPINTDGDVLVVGKQDHSDVLVESAAAADAVRALLGGTPVAPLLCFERLEPVAGVAGDVALCASENILDLLTSQPQILDAAAVARASGRISAACRPGPVPDEPVQAKAPEPPARRPAVGPSVEELARARAAELAARAATATSEADSSAHPVSQPVSQPGPEHERHGFARALRRSRKAPTVVAPAPVETIAVVDSSPATVDSPVVGADESTSVVRLPHAVAEAGAALWRTLTESPDHDPDHNLDLDQATVAGETPAVVPEAVTEPAAVEAVVLVDDPTDVEAALAEAEARQLEAEARAASGSAPPESGTDEPVTSSDSADADLELHLSTEREAHDARARAAREALEQAQREALEAEAREQAEQAAREQAEREEAERLERERLEAEAREQAAREAEEAEARAAWEARLRSAREAREREAREAAARDAIEAEQWATIQRHQPDVRRAEVLLPDGGFSREPAQVAPVEPARVDVPQIAVAADEVDLDTWEPSLDDSWEPEVLDEPEPRRAHAVQTEWETPDAASVLPASERVPAQPAAAPFPATTTGEERLPSTSRLTRWRKARRGARSAAGAEAHGHGMPGRAIANVALGALLIAGVAVGAPHAHGVVTWAQQLVGHKGPTLVGTAVKVAADPTHPSVEVLAGTPVPARAASGAGAGKGQHLVAVPFLLHNTGASPWKAPVAAKASVIDELGVAHPVATAVTAVKAFPLLPAKTEVAPGQEVKGYVVFAVPDGRTVTSVKLGLSQTGSDLATWQVTP